MFCLKDLNCLALLITSTLSLIISSLCPLYSSPPALSHWASLLSRLYHKSLLEQLYPPSSCPLSTPREQTLTHPSAQISPLLRGQLPMQRALTARRLPLWTVFLPSSFTTFTFKLTRVGDLSCFRYAAQFLALSRQSIIYWINEYCGLLSVCNMLLYNFFEQS